MDYLIEDVSDLPTESFLIWEHLPVLCRIHQAQLYPALYLDTVRRSKLCPLASAEVTIQSHSTMVARIAWATEPRTFIF